jgi:peptidoglycan/LPS O-acetylase OafA/YrhL
MERTLTGRNNNFNLLRIVFASLVILSHSSELIDGNHDREILVMIFGTIPFGRLAVDGFFLLSGFLIVQSWERAPHFWDFVKKRVLRIYPAFIIASLLSAIIVGPLGANAAGYFAQIDFKELFKGLLLLRAPSVPPTFEGTPYPFVNGPLWTIEYEFRCYMLVALLGICGIFRKRQLWLGLTIIALLLALRQYVVAGFLNNHAFPGMRFLLADPVYFLRLVPFFLVGGCFYLFRDRITYKSTWALGAGIVLCGFLFYRPLAELGVAIFGAYLLFWFAFLQSPFLERFQGMDDISYGVYLYGWPIQKLLLWFIPSLSPWTLFPIALGLSALCGFASWRLVERPFLRLKPKMAVV